MPDGKLMDAIVFQGPRKVKLVQKPVPQLQLDGDVIVRPEISSICGTDLHPYRGEKAGLDEGTTMAHEMVGVVTEIGKDVKRLKVGQRIVSCFTTSCGVCWFCTHELTCRCEHELGARCYGWVSGGKGLDGVQAEYARVPLAETTLSPVPDNVTSEQALLCADVLPTGWFCAERAGVSELLGRQGKVTTAVVGCGPVGLAAIAAAISQGATKVYAVDRLPERLAIAQRFGAELIPEGQDTVTYLRSVTGGRGVDCIMEAVGAPAALRTAFDAVRVGGVISSVGMHHDDHFSFSPTEGYNKNITYRNGRCPARMYIDKLLQKLSQGDPALTAATQMITHRVSLRDEQGVIDAYKSFDKGEVIKVVVQA